MILKKLQLILFILKLDKYTYNRVYLKQRIKGIKKYKRPLEKCKLKDYNWKEMILEEIIDAFQYLEMYKKSKK